VSYLAGTQQTVGITVSQPPSIYFFSIMTIIGAVLPAALGAMVTAAGYQATILSIVPIVAVIFGATVFFARRASAVLIKPL